MGKKTAITEGLTYEIAQERFMLGFCPCCGGKMEERVRLVDYFCHSCRQDWNVGSLTSLRGRIPLF